MFVKAIANVTKQSIVDILNNKHNLLVLLLMEALIRQMKI